MTKARQNQPDLHYMQILSFQVVSLQDIIPLIQTEEV